LTRDYSAKHLIHDTKQPPPNKHWRKSHIYGLAILSFAQFVHLVKHTAAAKPESPTSTFERRCSPAKFLGRQSHTSAYIPATVQRKVKPPTQALHFRDWSATIKSYYCKRAALYGHLPYASSYCGTLSSKVPCLLSACSRTPAITKPLGLLSVSRIPAECDTLRCSCLSPNSPS
jgi:hypothetical protein